jgi:hypothetical protein
LVVYFHNSGPGSAFRFNAGFPGSKTAPFTHMTRTRNRKHDSISNGGMQDATIGADSDYSITEQLPPDWVARALRPNNQLHMIPAGMYEYCDESGNYTCKWFVLGIQGPPFNRVESMSNLNCAMPPNGFPLPTPTAELEYLPPCGDVR